jgi:hypothetical protein
MISHFRGNRKIPAIYPKFWVSVSAFCMIAASQVAAAQRVTAADVDTEILSAILKAAASDAGPVALRVDPRPLVDARYVYVVEPGSIAQVSVDVLRRRTDAIRAAGLSVVDTTIINESRNCPGALVLSPVDSLGRVEGKHVGGCPVDPFDVLAVGPPRPGKTVLPTDSVYDRDTETPARGYWAARVIRTTLGHGRSSTYAADYVLAHRGGTWVIVKKVGLIYSE